MSLSLGIIFALIAMLSWGVSRVFLKKLITRIGTYASLVYTYFFAVMFLVVLSMFSGDVVFPQGSLWWRILGTAVVGTVAIYLFFRAVEIGKVSIVTPVANSYVVLTVILSLLLLKEMITKMQALGVVVTIVGVLAVSFRWHELVRTRLSKAIVKGVPHALATAVGWGLFFVLLKFIVREIGPLSTTLFVESTIFVILLIPLVRIHRKKIAAVRNSTLLAAGAGLTAGVAAWSFNMAIHLIPVAIAAPIEASSLLVTVVLAGIFLKERLAVNQLVAILFIVIGIVILSI